MTLLWTEHIGSPLISGFNAKDTATRLLRGRISRPLFKRIVVFMERAVKNNIRRTVYTAMPSG